MSEQVANLPIKAQLLFTWMIPHADDFGLLPHSERTIKALVVPMADEITVDDVRACLECMMAEQLIEVVEMGGERFYRLKGFGIQKLRRDIKPHSIAKNISDWNDYEKVTKRVVTDTERPVPDADGSGEEVKRREEKILNTGAKRPENATSPRGMTSVGTIIQEKANQAAGGYDEAARQVLTHGSTVKSGVATPWQDKAFRYADKLGIKLTGSLTGRWMKMFKQASEGRKAANLEKAYSFLSDHPERDTMQQEDLVNYFFWIYENGLQKQFAK